MCVYTCARCKEQCISIGTYLREKWIGTSSSSSYQVAISINFHVSLAANLTRLCGLISQWTMSVQWSIAGSNLQCVVQTWSIVISSRRTWSNSQQVRRGSWSIWPLDATRTMKSQSTSLLGTCRYWCIPPCNGRKYMQTYIWGKRYEVLGSNSGYALL